MGLGSKVRAQVLHVGTSLNLGSLLGSFFEKGAVLCWRPKTGPGHRQLPMWAFLGDSGFGVGAMRDWV